MRQITKIAASLAVAVALAIAAGAATLKSVNVNRQTGLTQVTFIFNHAPKVNHFVLGSPPRAVIDLSSTRSKWHSGGSIEGPRIKDMRIARHQNGMLRTVLDLKSDAYWGGLSKAGHKRIVATIRSNHSDTSSKHVSKAAAKETAVTKKNHQATYHVTRSNKPAVVVLDPGHGGRDPGTTGPHGLHEKTVVLSIARMAQKKLNARPHIKAILTRHGDHYLSLPKRRHIAQNDQADLFVSIHANSYPNNRQVKGGTCYVLSKHGASNAKARQLAHFENNADPKVAGVNFSAHDQTLNRVLTDLFQNDSINAADNLAKAIISQFGRVEPLYHSKPQRANFSVLRDPMIPSVLCETAFLSNPAQARELHHQAFREKLADAIAKGIEHYFKRYPPMRKTAEKSGIYLVKSGDTLSSIAARHDISVAHLKTINHLKNSTLQVGQKLRVPAGHYADNKPPKTSTSRYTVKPGDTLSAIAAAHHVSVQKIVAANDLKSKQLRVGQKLILPAGAVAKRIVVNSGDTLSQIAQENGTSIKRLKKYNGLDSDQLAKGQVLWLPKSGTQSS